MMDFGDVLLSCTDTPDPESFLDLGMGLGMHQMLLICNESDGSRNWPEARLNKFPQESAKTEWTGTFQFAGFLVFRKSAIGNWQLHNVCDMGGCVHMCAWKCYVFGKIESRNLLAARQRTRI